MSQPGNVKKKGIRGHFDDPFAIGPSQILGRVMVKDIGDKYAFLAIADRTGYPTVVAIDTSCKIVRHFFQTIGGLTRFGKHVIPVLRAPLNQQTDGIPAGSRFGYFCKVELI